MDWILFNFILVWLVIISWFDIKHEEIPHSAWVVLPFSLAIIYQSWMGHWSLVLLSVLVAATSERERLSGLVHYPSLKMLPVWLPFFVPFLYWAVQTYPLAALALLGFWVAWELRCWGGADAVAAMTLVLIYPGWIFILAFLVSHLLVLVGMGLFSLFKERKIRLHRLPGLPVLLAAVALMQVYLWVWPYV